MATQLAENKGVLGLENPMGTDGFEFVEYTAPDTTLLRDLFTKMGFPAVAQAQAQGRDPAPPGRDQLHHQCGKRQLRRAICKGPWPERLRDGVSG